MYYLIWIIVGIGSAIASFIALNWKKATPFWKVLIIIWFFLSLVLVVWGGYRLQKEDKEAESAKLENELKEKSGELVSRGKKKATRPILKFIGTNTSFSGIDSSALQIGGLELEVVDGELLVSYKVYDIDGSDLAVIDYNNWNYLKPGLDYNSDKNGLEVVTKDLFNRKVIFQIHLRNNVVYFGGLNSVNRLSGFYCYPSYSMVNGRIDSGLSMTLFDKDKPLNAIPADKLKPLFKYPRSQFPHQRQ